MIRAIFFITSISICLFLTNAFGEEATSPPNPDSIESATPEPTYILDEIAESEYWPKIWGKKGFSSRHILQGPWC